MFMSRAFSSSQSKYSTTDREALGCLLGLEEARPLIMGSKFSTVLYTDHQALTGLLMSDDAKGRIARWQNRFAEYDLVIVHVPGKTLALADGLSRLPAHAQLHPFSGDLEHEIGMFEVDNTAGCFDSISHALAVFAIQDLEFSLSQAVPVVTVEAPPPAVEFSCATYGASFPSRNCLFCHLRVESHFSTTGVRTPPPQVPVPQAVASPSKLHKLRKRRCRQKARSDYRVGLADAVATWTLKAYNQLVQACADVYGNQAPTFIGSSSVPASPSASPPVPVCAAPLPPLPLIPKLDSSAVPVTLEQLLGDPSEGEPDEVAILRRWS